MMLYKISALMGCFGPVGGVLGHVALANENAPRGVVLQVEGVQWHRGGQLVAAVFQSRQGFPLALERAWAVQWTQLLGNQEVISLEFKGLRLAMPVAAVVFHEEKEPLRFLRTLPPVGVGFSNTTLWAHGTEPPRFSQAHIQVPGNGGPVVVPIKITYPERHGATP